MGRGGVDESTHMDSALLACVEVAVGPVFVNGSTQRDFVAATC